MFDGLLFMNTTKLMFLVISAIIVGYIINNVFYANVVLEPNWTIMELSIGFIIGSIIGIYKKRNDKKDLTKPEKIRF